MHVVLGGQSQIKSMDLTLNGIRESFLLSQIGLHLVVFIALTGSSSSRGYLMMWQFKPKDHIFKYLSPFGETVKD